MTQEETVSALRPYLIASTLCAALAAIAFTATTSYPGDYSCPPAAKCVPPVLTIETFVGTFEREMMSVAEFEDARWTLIAIALSLDLACAIKIMILIKNKSTA